MGWCSFSIPLNTVGFIGFDPDSLEKKKECPLCVQGYLTYKKTHPPRTLP